MEFLHQLDLTLLRWLNQDCANTVLDWFFPRMAAPHFYIIPILLAAIWILIQGGSKGRVFLVTLLIAVGVGDGVIVNSLKKWVNRPRPHEAVEGVRLVKKEGVEISHPQGSVEKGRSFPSAHVCNNVALAMVVVFFYGKRFRWFYLWAALMMWNRVYVGSHYPSDVIFSCFIATGYTWAFMSLVQKICERKGWNDCLSRHS